MMMIYRNASISKCLFSLVQLCLAGTLLRAADVPLPAVPELKVFQLFSDHGILQQDTQAPIWGTAGPGATVTVTFRGSTVIATADPDGKWMARLQTPKALPAQQGSELDITSGTQKIALQDVVVGEVWLGSGQSNMDTNMTEFAVGRDELPRANNPDFRIFTPAGWAHRGDYSKYKWSLCTPASAKPASATGYFFSRDLQQALQVPVGFVQMAYSGSSMGMWVQPKWLADDPRTAAEYAKFHNETLPVLVLQRKDALAKWEIAVADAAAKGQPLPRRPFVGMPEDAEESIIGGYYHTHIAQVVPFAFRGMLWDQGEAGVGIPGHWLYDVVFDIMITNWRKEFGRDMPVIYCQMPKGGAWGPQTRLVNNHTGELLDLVQLTALPAEAPMPGNDFQGFAKEPDPFARMAALPICYMAVTRDLDVATHPPDKDRYGHRFFLTAMNQVYGKADVACAGPLMKSATREGEQVRVAYDNLGGGLVALGDHELQGFFVTGHDRATGKTRSVWATCRIDGDTVLLSSADLDRIDLVSYAHTNGGRVMWANLFNKGGLPAYPMTLKVQ